MKLTFLGTGTSTGVPQIRCKCEVCTSQSPFDKRLRASVLVETGNKNILIDCGPDFRQQILGIGSLRLDALLITHIHYDHVGGIDDLRPYCYPDSFPVYCKEDVAKELRMKLPYCFGARHYPGAPTFDMHIVEPGKAFMIGDVEVLPVEVMHYRLPILGYRIGELAYITDCKTIPQKSIDLLKGVDILVVNALRHQEHMSHMNLPQALELIEKVAPRVAYLTHMSHQIGLHEEVSKILPPHVHFAYDGLEIQKSV